MSRHDGIRSEDAAVYGYGLLLVYADSTISRAIDRMLGEHRERADAARALWPDADPAAVGYTLGMSLRNADDALLLAIRLESDCCEGWRAHLQNADTDSADHLSFAMDALDAAAIQLARWRSLIPGAPFEALPGFPPQK